MKVVLINAIVGEATGSLKHGIGMISSCLKHNDIEVVTINNPDQASFSDYSDVKIFGISGLTSSVPRMQVTAKKIKKAVPDAVIFVGGPGPTLSSEFFEHIPEIDYIFKGEAEITFPKIIEAFRVTGELPKEKIVFGEIVHDVSSLPYVDRDIFVNGEVKFTLLMDMEAPMYSMMNSRWCRKKCKFCAPAMSSLFGGVRKLRTVEHFMGEIETLPTDNMTMVINDDNMLENSDWCYELIDAFKERDLFIPFVMQAYPPEVMRGAQLLSDLKGIGLVGVIVGFESGSNRMLKHMNKGSTRDINIKAAEVLHKLDLRIQANLMFGNPTETLDEMMETVTLYNGHIRRDGYSWPGPATYTPHPGSAWYDELKESGDINISDFSMFERYAWTAGKLKSVNYDYVRMAQNYLLPADQLVKLDLEDRH